MLSKQSLDILLDLVEIKLSSIMILDKDDIREIQRLKNCKNELLCSKRSLQIKTVPSNGDISAAIC
ncbi:MAG: hypothetical protein LBG20_02805 [Holosporaceae bacterium]|jgi:hypothetical protein|nr:hypothetical protein [Holosporaceae bacterium]